MAENSRRSAKRRAGGRPFRPGQSGNPGGRPKGSKTYSVREIVAKAIDAETEAEAILRLRESLRQRKTVVNTLEFAAKLSREIGLGSGETPGGVTVILMSNIEPTKLGVARARALAIEASP